MVVIFPNPCLWRRNLCSNLGGIDPEKLYRATLNLTVSAEIHEPEEKPVPILKNTL